MKKILIVGGVAGGATAAARLRRLSEEDEIIMFERDEYISFANCGLPYYIGNVITDREDLLVQTVEGMSERFNLDIRNFSEVVDINRAEKTVTVKKTKTGDTYQESYDVLILSPGAKPIFPPIEGIKEANNLFTLRNIPDTDAIYRFIETKQPKTAVVVGGGFIGVEMAENLTERGIKVTLVEKLPQVLAPLDFEMAQIVHKELNTHGVELVLGDGLLSFANHGRTINLESGKPQYVRRGALANLKNATFTRSIQEEEFGPVKNVVEERFNIKELDGLTEEDIEILASKQKMFNAKAGF